MSQIELVWKNLWLDYTSFNPHAKKIYDLLLKNEIDQGSKADHLVNDHVAFRTFQTPGIGLDDLAQIFLDMGYVYKQEYHFKEKKLYAKHYEHSTNSKLPKVFISELLTKEFSQAVQAAVDLVGKSVPKTLVSKPEMLWSGRTWEASHKTYQALLGESEYAAWMYVFGFRPNHFTVSFNDLTAFKTLGDLNTYLKAQGFSLNSSGGEIKGSVADCLEQSSTLAGKVKVQFLEGEFEVPACYYEFAKRYPMSDGRLYTGFVAASADKIFESTDVRHQ